MNTTKFNYVGNDIFVVQLNENTTKGELAPAVYTLNFSPQVGYYLTFTSNGFDVPSQLYGSANARSDRIVTAYKAAVKSLGVLATGDKGSGKTLLTAVTANKMIAEGFPVVIVNSTFSGNGFSEFLGAIGEVVVVFDEFGKLYEDDDGEQNRLLTLFDGTESHKRLYLLTENEERKVGEFFLNRPGRLHYHFRYNKLEQEVITEYCAGRVSADVLADITMIYRRSVHFSFDILQALVREYETFGGDIVALAQDLNIGFSVEPKIQYRVVKFTSQRGNDVTVLNPHGTIRSLYAPSIVVDYTYVVPSKPNKAQPSQLHTVGEVRASFDNERDEAKTRHDDVYFRSCDIVYQEDDKMVFDDGENVAVIELIFEDGNVNEYAALVNPMAV